MSTTYALDEIKSEIFAEKKYKGRHKTVANKAADVAAEWWSSYGTKMYKTNVRMGINAEDVKNELYDACYEHTIATFGGGFIAMFIIQMIVSYVVRKIIERLLRQYLVSEKHTIIGQSTP
jgi:hypothetical protein